ncbi:MAG: hypothetical protein K8R88_09225 [Armatimonadetes bacterium]|nr:hypothetical protein [Armatimonadota bacterium]
MTKFYLTAFAFLAMAGNAFGFWEQKEGKVIVPEVTERELEQAQKYQVVAPEVGVVSAKGEKQRLPMTRATMGAEKSLISSQKQALASLTNATEELSSRKTEGTSTWLLFSVFGIGLGLAAGFKVWADRSLPDPKIRVKRAKT